MLRSIYLLKILTNVLLTPVLMELFAWTELMTSNVDARRVGMEDFVTKLLIMNHRSRHRASFIIAYSTAEKSGHTIVRIADAIWGRLHAKMCVFLFLMNDLQRTF